MQSWLYATHRKTLFLPKLNKWAQGNRFCSLTQNSHHLPLTKHPKSSDISVKDACCSHEVELRLECYHVLVRFDY